MNKLLIFLLLLSNVLYAQNKSVIVQGNIQGLQNDTIFVWSYLLSESDNIKRDTIVSKNDKFNYKMNVNGPTAIAVLPKKSFIARVDGRDYMPQGRFIELFASPKDTSITVKGILEPLYLTYSVSGSKISQEYTAQRIRYKPLEIEIAKIELHRDSLSAFAGTKEESNRLFDLRIKKQNEEATIKVTYVNAHLNDDISAYLLSRLSLITFARNYPKLTEKVRHGFFKDMLDKQYQTYLNYTASKKAETELTQGAFAPDFKLTSIDGKQYSLADFKGQIIVLDFWGTWCGPCVSEIPKLKLFHDSLKKKVKLIGIDCDDKKQDLIRMVETHQINWLQLINSEENSVSVLYGIMAYPTKIVIDRNFKIVNRFVGISDEFYALIDELTK